MMVTRFSGQLAAVFAAALIGFSLPAAAQLGSSGPEAKLFKAMEEGKEAEFSLLLINLSPNLRGLGRERVPALIMAVESKNPFFVRELLKKGARPDDTPPDNRSALTRAVELSQPTMVKLLLEHKADPDLSGKSGETALIIGARLGQEDIVRLLLDAGADRELGDLTGRTPDEAAERAGFHHIARIIRDAE